MKQPAKKNRTTRLLHLLSMPKDLGRPLTHLANETMNVSFERSFSPNQRHTANFGGEAVVYPV